MKHFILEGKHLVPFNQFAHLEAEHHQFLQDGYDGGAFLFSGPQIPPHGGFLAARAESRERLDALLAGEPFVKGGYMQFVSVTEFDPVQHQPVLKEWFGGGAIHTGKHGSIAHSVDGSVSAGRATRHFLLEGEHLVPFDRRDPALITAHRRFLQTGYDKGTFLMSGPTIPPKGGFLVARAGSLPELNEMLAEEPYNKSGVMRFKTITEFNPLQRQPFLDEWFSAIPREQIEREEKPLRRNDDQHSAAISVRP